MALHELHARRLATVITMVERALDRIELVLRGIEDRKDPTNTGYPLSEEELRQLREGIESLRNRLKQAVERFTIQRTKPEPRQVMTAELSALWVTLENAMPKRMKGYGREFAPDDKNDWERLVLDLLQDVEQIRKIALPKNIKK
jgi:protoporphyrinogen oxidase